MGKGACAARINCVDILLKPFLTILVRPFSHVDGISVQLIPNVVNQCLKIGLQVLNLSVEAITGRRNTRIILHLTQHAIKIVLNMGGKLPDLSLTLELTNLFHLIQNRINATIATTNLPKRRLNLRKLLLKPILATPYTVLARLNCTNKMRGIVLQLRMKPP
ncbi:DUF3267 domain-containing protein [Babesia caballi]|uniref:DUF3267 domain-containing protein n=1 Tax=Babesia caballi TaxID=5871 RepID=A0AAV4M0Q0_BABCB|nr:DUF3267 domain-containing protein [Babesia caballi]